VYRILVDRNAVDVNYEMDRFGVMIGHAAKRGRHDLVRLLLERGAHPDEEVELEGHISTLAAAAQYSDAKMVGMLLDGGAKLKGTGALSAATKHGNLDTMRLLLARGADVNEMGIITWDERSVLYAGSGKCLQFC